VAAEIVILDGARTPFGTYCGSLRDVTATDMGVVSAKGPFRGPDLSAVLDRRRIPWQLSRK